MRSVLVLAALAMACIYDSGPNGVCTLIGCGSIADVKVSEIEEAALAGATITLCINDRCASRPAPEPPPVSWGDNVGDSVPLTGAFDAGVTLYRIAGLIGIHGHFNSADMLANGDVFSATVRASDGTVLATHSWTATYMVTFPNGRNCDPVEGCFHAQLTPL
jgi:hypothetical protein